MRGEPATREDILEFLQEGRWNSVLDPDEIAMLQGVLEVSQTQVRDVMVPRSQMVVLERDAPKAEILKAIVESGHSRYPVIGEDRDEVIGVLLAKDILRYFVETPDQEFDLRKFIRPAIVIPESKRLNTLLKEFRISRNHLAIVVDEYGATAGLLTIEDVLEEIVGEIGDEYDAQEAEPIQKQDGNRFQVLALTRIEDFNEYFGSELNDEDYDTVGGLVMYELGRLPRRGESVSLGGFRFKVLQADRRRLHTLEVTPGIAGCGRLTVTGVPLFSRLAGSRTVRGRLSAVLAGLALPLAFAPFGLYLIAPLSLAILFWSWNAAPREAAWRGFWFGAAAFAAGTWWIYVSVRLVGGTPLPVAVLLLAGLIAIMAAWIAACGYLAARLRGPSPAINACLLTPALWVLAEWLRGWVLTGFPVAEHRLWADRWAARRLGAASVASTR